MSKRRKRYTKKDVFIYEAITALVFVLVFLLAFIIISFDDDKVINKITAGYISFNNNDTTDMLKITNLKRMKNNLGTSHKNKSYKEFEITGEENQKYNIVLYHIGNTIDEEYVHYVLYMNGVEKEKNVLKNLRTTANGGIIVYDGVIDKNNNCIIKMWIDNSYKKNIKNISYEIRVA